MPSNLGSKFEYGHSDDKPEVKKFILAQKGKIFVDVGANTGFYCLRLSRNFEKIYAFEPMPGTAQYILDVLSRENIKNIEVREKAISNYVGGTSFHISPRGHKCHSLMPVGLKEIRVLCSTLSRELKNEKSIDLVKVDVEGSEFEVLEGADGIIRNIKAWVIEVHDLKEICGMFAVVRGTFQDRKDDMEETLQKYGYKTKWLNNKTIYAWREK